MSESGGPTTQSGIYYQNTVAALHLARMLDLRQRRANDRIVEVRLEAPTAVDDIVVRTADGAHRYIQAKVALTASGAAWNKLWESFSAQCVALHADVGDRIALWIGEFSPLAEDLRDCAARTAGTSDDGEYLARLTLRQRRTFDAIVHAFGGTHDVASTRSILGRLDVEIAPEGSIERDYAPTWIPQGIAPQTDVLAILRDLAGGAARVRGRYVAHTLRERLRRDHGIEVPEPDVWGAAVYRSVLRGKAVIEVPGTGFAKPVSEAFLWPRATRYDRSRRPDFDDEAAFASIGSRTSDVDLKLFPVPGFDRVVVVAGPGFGKSALMSAIAVRRLEQGRLPVQIAVPDLADSDLTVIQYLNERVNRSFSVAIDWAAAADAGIAELLFDGLDEVSSDRRKSIIDKVATFSLRYPLVPWLLTVRDAAALAAPTGAVLVELEPLDDPSIRAFITCYRTEEVVEQIIRRFRSRPDLQRLARIPLFLALLLETVRDVAQLPSSRRELLESYIEVMFHAEQFKPTERDGVDAAVLRPIVEAIAFDALEREEIGIRARVLETAVRAHLPEHAPVQPVIEKLVRCGLLRRSGPARYEFCFPIVQEYLAACHILQNRVGEVIERLAVVHKRPWAQALQFVVEAHPAPHDLLTQLLAREDDAFDTNLRLVARCVANGTPVGPDMRAEIGRRLASCWAGASWRRASQIGDLIAEAFCVPPVAELRAMLSNRGLLHHGIGEIVQRIDDPALTRDVLAEFLDGDVEMLLNLGELQKAVDEIADEALAMYATRARATDGDKGEWVGLAALIGHLDRGKVSESARLAVALDSSLPVPMRLAAFLLGPSPVDERAEPLIAESLVSNDFISPVYAVAAIATMPDAVVRMRDALLAVESVKDATALASHAINKLPSSKPQALFRALAEEELLSSELRDRLRVFAARFGDADAMTKLIDDFGTASSDVVSAAVSIFGHHRSASLIEAAVARLTGRVLSPEERVSIALSAVTGMTEIFEMDWFHGGVVKDAPPHPGLATFRTCIEAWGAMTDYTPIQALEIDHALTSLGSDTALHRLSRRIEAALPVRNKELDSHTVGHALRVLAEHHATPTLQLLVRVVDGCSYNGASAAVELMATLDSRDAFDSLMAVYHSTAEWMLRRLTLDALETLAARLGVRVRRVGKRLELAV